MGHYKSFNSSITETPIPQNTNDIATNTINMVQASEVLSRKAGVIVGDDLHKLFKHAQSEGYAIPAINVTSSSTVVASLEAARDSKSPIILQLSNGGAAYFAGKGVANSKQEASIA